jgi:CHAT domain-containing protein
VAAGQDDGILTAEEIASLNLDGVHWAVLSACETGLGEYRANEGMMGFRRAFLIAGARTTIMSLWRVDDRTTARWMRTLYENRWQRGYDTAQSMRESSLAELRARRSQRLGTHPAHWGAFIAVGDWR